MKKRLGDFEFSVMAAIAHLGDAAYGVPIREAIEENTGREIAVGAIYTTLQRLENKGYVISRQGEPTAKRGGRARRYYRVTSEGQSVLDNTLTAMRSMVDGWVRT